MTTKTSRLRLKTSYVIGWDTTGWIHARLTDTKEDCLMVYIDKEQPGVCLRISRFALDVFAPSWVTRHGRQETRERRARKDFRRTLRDLQWNSECDDRCTKTSEAVEWLLEVQGWAVRVRP